MSKVNLGWLKDKNGDKFAPKTITTQVISETGGKLEDRLKNTEKVLDKKITSPETAKIGQLLEVEEIDESGKPVKWRTIDAPNNQIQADWNQNDETQLDYVKNKPFYSGYGNRLELMPFSKYEFYYVSPTYTGHHDFGNYSEEGLFANDDLYIKLNKKYEVNWNGVVYELTGKSFIHDNIEYIYIGNLYFHSSVRYAAENTGEPFLFVGTKYRQLEVICNYNEVSNDYVNLSLHECSDKDEYEVVARYLDEKYIPNNIPKIKSASVGQLLVVLGVDLDGKPNSFGVVDNNFVEKTQYANSSQAGLVKTSTSYGTQMSSEYIQTCPATQSDIKSKTHNYRPIVPKQLDYAVKEGLANNKLSWTDTEKQNARNLIGIVNSDWNQYDSTKADYISNRPFYEDNKYGDFSFDVICHAEGTTGDRAFYGLQIHNYLLSPNSIEYIYLYKNNVKNASLVYDSEDENYLYYKDTTNGYILVVYKQSTTVYLNSSNLSLGETETLTCNIKYITSTNIVQLDEKYIPNSIPKVNMASVGQTLEVEEVDENGKPIKWKASNSLSPIAKVEQIETGAIITIEDKNGVTTASVHHGKDGKTPYIDEDGYIVYEDIDIAERIEKTIDDTIVELEPNKLYVFPEMTALSYTLLSKDTSKSEEYHFIFQSGETPTEVLHPEGVKIGGFTVEANKVYEVSILEGLLLSQSWAVE